MSDKPERYLVCLDGSENAERAALWAADLAGRTGAMLTLLHVVHWDDQAWANTGQLATLPELHDTLEADAWGQVLNPMEKALREAGHDADCHLVFGRPAESVSSVAEKIDASLIVAGTRGQSALMGMIVGSVSHRLLQLAKRPVILIP